MTSLEALGMNQWFQEKSESLCAAEHTIARVVGVDRGQYTIRDESGKSFAVLTGKFTYEVDSAEDIPCVGDWVCVEHQSSDTPANIHQVLQRQSFLRRKVSGEEVEYQMIGANIDVAFIAQSCLHDFNMNRLERFLVMVNDGHVEPVLLLTKTDLITVDELEILKSKIRDVGIENKIIALSNVNGSGIEQVHEIMGPKKTYCLLGSSGVGKTTLINQLQGNDELETQAVHDTGEGRHTTRRRSLHMLKQGAMLIDMPGVRELGILSAAKGLDESFSDIVELTTLCRFANCGHTNEPQCAVLAALKDGTLNQAHFDNYTKLKKETERNEMSFADKRKNGKDFSKLIAQTSKGRKY